MLQSYNHLRCSFPAKREVLYPAKNRGELKRVYDNIVSLSKGSPFYMIDLTKENQEYTIGIKEKALELRARLYSMQDPEISGFDDKTIKVSDESILSAILLNEDLGTLPDSLQIKVNSVAKVQVNKGKRLLNGSFALPAIAYKFIAHVMDETYPLTYVHPHRMSNEDALGNIAEFINQSIPGISAEVEKEDSGDYSRLVISSDLSGRFGDKKFTFEEEDLDGGGIVSFFYMNNMENPPSCANFELNGVEKQTATNTFTLENTINITLNKSGEEPVEVKVVPDSVKILKAVDSVISTYNDIIILAKNHSQLKKDSYSPFKLINEMKNLVNSYHEELTACGIKVREDGILFTDESLSVAAAEDGGMESLFTRENGFITVLVNKCESIAINPVDYLEKTIVFYPNNGKLTFSNPYVTSMYSGMLFSSYC